MLVDRSADHDNQVLTGADRRRLRRRLEGTAVEGPGQHLGSIRLEVGHLARSDAVDGGKVGVEQDDPKAGIGECEPKGQPHVAAASED
jgi:hypothetical protein